MEESKTEKANAAEMLSFGGTQFAANIFMAFSSFYLMMFFTDVALIPPATTAVLLLFYRLFSAVDAQAIALFINRKRFTDGKYRPYYKWCALPFAVSLAALGMTPYVSIGRVIYAAFILIICDLSWTTLQMASFSMLPYLARDDASRSEFVSFSNGSSILAYILVGTFMLPLTDFLGGGERSKGFALALTLLAIIAVPFLFNAYFRLKERFYSEPRIKPAIQHILLAIGRNRRIILFMAGFCIYSMADAFKNLTTYYYMIHIVGRPDLLPAIILAGLLSPLAMQPVIPRLLAYARKEGLIVFGLFTSSCSSLLMLAAGNRPFALIACIALYGMFTAIVSNMVFAVMASFSDEIRTRQNISMSEILAATMNLSSNIGIGIASAASALGLAVWGYEAQTATQTAGALMGIKALYILCTTAGMVFAGVLMLLFRKKTFVRL